MLLSGVLQGLKSERKGKKERRNARRGRRRVEGQTDRNNLVVCRSSNAPAFPPTFVKNWEVEEEREAGLKRLLGPPRGTDGVCTYLIPLHVDPQVQDSDHEEKRGEWV